MAPPSGLLSLLNEKERKLVEEFQQRGMCENGVMLSLRCFLSLSVRFAEATSEERSEERHRVPYMDSFIVEKQDGTQLSPRMVSARGHNNHNV